MSAATLFAVPEPVLKPGKLYEETAKTVRLIENTPGIATSLAGQCGLALQLALEADNLDPTEKAYARVKVYEALSGILDRLHQAIEGAGAATGSQLAAVVNLVVADDEDDEGANL